MSLQICQTTVYCRRNTVLLNVRRILVLKSNSTSLVAAGKFTNMCKYTYQIEITILNNTQQCVTQHTGRYVYSYIISWCVQIKESQCAHLLDLPYDWCKGELLELSSVIIVLFHTVYRYQFSLYMVYSRSLDTVTFV